MVFIKRFLTWISVKEKLDNLKSEPPLFQEGEIWWSAIGENIGVEISGKDKTFSRPVLVFKKFSQYGFLGIPLSTQIKRGTWYVAFKHQGKEVCANLSQTRFFSVKRFYNKLGTLDEGDFAKTKQAFADLFCNNSPIVSSGNVGSPKYDTSIASEKCLSNTEIIICDKLNNMKQIILIHGSPEPDEIVTRQEDVTAEWFYWLQKNLPKVVIPPMPLEVEVVYEDWLKVFQEIETSDEDILIGHSCGGGFVLRYLSEHPEKVFKKVILVAPWIDVHNELSTDFMKFEIDGGIADRIETHIFISSDDSQGILDSVKSIKEKLVNATYYEFTDREHFTGKEFPELLELLK